MADYDLAIIGGGLNGVSIARDAAGRGLRVILLEQGDLGSAASAASPRLVHGDLAVLERRGLAPRAHGACRARHLAAGSRRIWCGRCGLRSPPIPTSVRPGCCARGYGSMTGLASPSGLPGAATVDVTHHPLGNALKRPFGTAFEYSDCVVDDSRLVIANAVDAAERGADIRTGARCVRADRLEIWRLAVIDRGRRRVITARALVNASGAWTASVAETVLRLPPPRAAAMQLSQIVVRRLFETDNVYVFQNSDRRLIFASPYERDFTLIGTVGHAVQGRSGRGVDGGRRRRLSLRRRQPVFSRAGRTVRRDQDDFRRQHGRGPRQPASRARRRHDVRRAAPQGAAADGLRRRCHDLAAARGAGGLEADAVLPDVAALDREGAAARRRFRLGPLRGRGRSRARALALPRRGRGAAPGRRLRIASCRRARRRQGAAPISVRRSGRN